MNATHAIHNVLRSLDLLLFNQVDELEADWEPKVGEIVLFKNEKGEFVTGAYQGRWQDVRKVNWSKERLATDTSFEPSPIPFDSSIMAKCNHATRNERGEWVIEFNFSFADIADILPYDNSAIEYALLSNQAHAKRVAMDMAVAS